MSNEETIFSNRTNQDIDEALAWLDELAGQPKSQSRAAVLPRSAEVKPVDQFNLPTWLRLDIRVEPPTPAESASEADEDNLSWLDSFTNGAASSIEEPPTMNWADTDVYAGDAQIRETQAAMEKHAALDDLSADTPVPDDDDEDTSVTELEVSERAAVDPDFETQPVRDEPAAESDQMDVNDTARLERPIEEDTQESAERDIFDVDGFPELPDIADLLAQSDASDAPRDQAKVDATADDFPDLPNIADMLASGSEAVASEEKAKTSIVPPDIDDPFFDISDQAIADWLNSAEHGTELRPPSTAGDFPELGDIISADLEDTAVILPDSTPDDLAAEVVSADAPSTDEDATEVVSPATASIPEMEATHLLAPDVNEAGDEAAQVDDALLAEAHAEWERQAQQREALGTTNVVPYDLDELTDELLAEAEKTTKPGVEDTHIVPYELDELSDALLAEAEANADVGTQVLPYDLDALSEQLLAEEASPDKAEKSPSDTATESLSPKADESTRVVPYDLEQLTDELLAEVEDINADLDEGTAVVAPQLPNANELPDLPEIADLMQESEAAAVVDDNLQLPSEIEWLDDVANATTFEEIKAATASPPKPAKTEPPKRAQSNTDFWKAQLPEDADELAALSAPTIVASVPISERWRQAQEAEDSAETEALDLLDSPKAEQDILDTVHADVAPVNKPQAEQLTDLTEPNDYRDQPTPEQLLDQTEPVDYSPRMGSLENVLNLADGIPDDPDEAIAWLEQMARQEFEPAPPKQQTEPTVVPEEVQDALQPTAGVKAADEMESFMQQLEAAMDAGADVPPKRKRQPMPQQLPDDLSDALAWLEDLVTGADNPLDETTVELDEADVQALLNQVMPQPPLPEPERAPTPPEPAKKPKPELDTRPVSPADSGSVEEPPSSELDDALAWLEAFANEESSLIMPSPPTEPVREQPVESPVRPYHEVRIRAESALTLGDYQQVAREYTALIEHEKSAALDVVIEDLNQMTRQVSTSPLLYRVLGDAYSKQLNFEMAAQAYRNGLDVL